MSVFDKPRILLLAMGKGFRTVRRRVSISLTSPKGVSGFVPDRLVIAPQDLRTADPTMAQEYYSGCYSFGSKTVQTGGRSPFSVRNPSKRWEQQLHEFGWFRHMSATTDPISASHARAMVKDWIVIYGRNQRSAPWEIETTSRRLIAWLCHSIIILKNPDHEFHQQFMISLGTHVRFLIRHAGTADAGMPRLLVHIALAYASICFGGNSSSLDYTRSKLSEELASQLFADGGHVSRNPAVIVELLTLLLPLKQGYASMQVEQSEQFINSIERMLPALRFFRMGDGNIARFNGSGNIPRDLTATLVRYDETYGEPLLDASQSGYQRLVKGGTIVLMDTGEPPRGELSVNAHAGCLSFELSDQQESLIINCGTPTIEYRETAALWRATAAHSTAVINNTSSCKFDSTSTVGRLLGGQIFSGQLNVQSSRSDADAESSIIAGHGGYVRDFGIRHQRTLTLNNDGSLLQGGELFSEPGGVSLRSAGANSVTIHFHLHPDVAAQFEEETGTCLLQTRQGNQWRFDCPDYKVDLEESIFFASIPASRKTTQIVIKADIGKMTEINWSLQKI